VPSFDAGEAPRRSTSSLGDIVYSPFEYLLEFTPAIPVLLIAVIGIALALRRRLSQPASSRLVIIGLVALSAHAVGTVLLHLHANRPFNKYEDASVYAQHLAWIKFILYVVSQVGVASITAAVFVKRKA
jgi:hypothetical protein